MAASALNASSVFLGSRVATPSTRRAWRSKRASKVAVRAKQCEESDLMAKYPEGGPVFRVSIDCTMGTNSTGIVMKEGDEGRPEVSAIRPGGTAKNKLKVRAARDGRTSQPSVLFREDSYSFSFVEIAAAMMRRARTEHIVTTDRSIDRARLTLFIFLFPFPFLARRSATCAWA